jgi:Cu/Ag efflux pump CusA
MTAFTSFFGLLPLLFGAGQPGKEILYPLTVVVFGGMLGSTLLDQIVTPALFHLFGARVVGPRRGDDPLGHPEGAPRGSDG